METNTTSKWIDNLFNTRIKNHFPIDFNIIYKKIDNDDIVETETKMLIYINKSCSFKFCIDFENPDKIRYLITEIDCIDFYTLSNTLNLFKEALGYERNEIEKYIQSHYSINKND